MLNFGSIRRWIMILVGIALATSMLVQQMAFVVRHNGDFFSMDDHPPTHWKLVGFEQERHHHNEAEDTNYTWINEAEHRDSASFDTNELLKPDGNSTSTTVENPWMKILRNANVQVSIEQENLLPELENDWKELFGMEPKILGMETVRV